MCYLYKFCTLTEYENMIPYELDVFSDMLSEHNKQQTDAARTQESLITKMEAAGSMSSIR